MIKVRTEQEFISYHAHPLHSDPEKLHSLRAYAGYDPGKVVHPGHFSVLLLDCLAAKERFCQIASIWFPKGTRYIDQIARIRQLMKELHIEAVCYDATRGELEALREQGLLSGFKPVTFTPETKAKLAGRLNLLMEQKRLRLLPDERQRRSILQVNSVLHAGETETGHGDAFWSNALALEAKLGRKPSVADFLVRLHDLYGLEPLS